MHARKAKSDKHPDLANTRNGTLRIYLSGSIKKGRTDSRSDQAFWTDANENEIRRLVTSEVALLNPAKSNISRNDFFINYGCDLYLIKCADIVVADLRMEKGIGVGAELMFARFIKRPVIGWLPRNSYYQRDKVEDVFGEDLYDWTHPFAFGLCDFIAEDLTEVCNHINRLSAARRIAKSDSKSPERAIDAYRHAYHIKASDD